MRPDNLSTPAATFAGPDDVLKRTQECLAQLESRFNEAAPPAAVILIVGRTGVGKSSLLEDLTNTKGHAQQSVDSVTKEFEIDKAIIEGKEYFVMDTPGFEVNKEQQAFSAIVRGIQAVRSFARITGVLYLTCINQTRLEVLDFQILRLIQALCGSEFFPRVAIVTTFWTAASEYQREMFESQLKLLEGKWQECFGSHTQAVYNHGRGYDPTAPAYAQSKEPFIDWFENRAQVAQHAREMIAYRYGAQQTSTFCLPRIVQELNTDVPVHETEAGKLLGLPAPSTGSTKPPSNDPGVASTSSRPSQPNQPEDVGNRDGSNISLGQLLIKGVSWVFDNVQLDFGSGSGHGFSFGSSVPTGSTRHSLGSGLDPLSSVDVMKSFGMDASPEGRMRYATEHKIRGTPQTAEWGENIRQHVLRNHR